MKKINLRDANQQFSRLVREVEEKGETIVVLRNGVPAAEIGPVRERTGVRRLNTRQLQAIQNFLKAARSNPGSSEGQPRWTRDDLHAR